VDRWRAKQIGVWRYHLDSSYVFHSNTGVIVMKNKIHFKLSVLGFFTITLIIKVEKV